VEFKREKMSEDQLNKELAVDGSMKKPLKE
jgi:hypothetical protein